MIEMHLALAAVVVCGVTDAVTAHVVAVAVPRVDGEVRFLEGLAVVRC